MLQHNECVVMNAKQHFNLLNVICILCFLGNERTLRTFTVHWPTQLILYCYHSLSSLMALIFRKETMTAEITRTAPGV